MIKSIKLVSLFLAFLLFFLAMAKTYLLADNREKDTILSPIAQNIPTPTTIEKAKTTKKPKTIIPVAEAASASISAKKGHPYTIVMLGDSMTNALGPHGGLLSEYLNTYYKPLGHGIIIDNYARPSTNILSLNEAISTPTKSWDVTFEPLVSRSFDMVLIESFGYNPLSQYGTEEGLRKQTEKLAEIVALLKNTQPKAQIVFVATIAPHKDTYGSKGNPGAPADQLRAQAEERMMYIRNHITYAQSHGIPVVNIFDKSLTSGDGNIAYINPDDNIHPSAAGLEFISRQLANYIYHNKILPW